MGKHYNGNGRDISKRGFTVEVKPGTTPEQNAKNLENALKILKRRTVQDGLIKDLRRKEYHVTKGQDARRKRQEAIRREKKRQKMIVD